MPEHIASISEISEAYFNLLIQIERLRDKNDNSWFELVTKAEPLAWTLKNCPVIIAVNSQVTSAIQEHKEKLL